jgi:hypothetical protein
MGYPPFYDVDVSIAEGDKGSERIGESRGERFEWKGLRRVETCGLGGVEVHKGSERG